MELEPGNTFRRYTAEGLIDTQIRAQVAQDPWSLPAEWVGFLLTAVLAAAGVVGFRMRKGPKVPKGPKPGHAEPDGVPSRDQLLRAVATLDEEFAHLEEPSAAARAGYKAERERLLAQLRQRS